ncbi:hypothetical protein [Eubacterium xylanophilum]|uniref:hypothetical protein n=1 Tax=Eubacterium xylanophilum TaxID=39497 RepID=UPI00047BA7A2|nr:hypothetical protein [Eubacterium xylanophilum]
MKYRNIFLRKGLKQFLSIFLLTASVFSLMLLQGCEAAGGSPDDAEVTYDEDDPESSPLFFTTNATAIKYTKNTDGGQILQNLENGKISDFRDWTLSLTLKEEKFDDGKTPDKESGVESYLFKISDKEPLEFTYVIKGIGQYYIKVDGKWYRVDNNKALPNYIK